MFILASDNNFEQLVKVFLFKAFFSSTLAHLPLLRFQSVGEKNDLERGKEAVIIAVLAEGQGRRARTFHKQYCNCIVTKRYGKKCMISHVSHESSQRI